MKKGKRRNRFRTLQIFQCVECLVRFTGAPGKNRVYPLKHILEAVSVYNLGHSLTETQSLLRKRSRLEIPERTIRSWLTAHRPLTTYTRFRSTAKKAFGPRSILQSCRLQHQQLYEFQVHQAKLSLLLEAPTHSRFAPLADYLAKVDKSFPHNLFQETRDRSSSFPADISPPVERKENHATRVAKLVLPTSPSNKKRHETLQRFMLINDSVTVAVEIPIYLTRSDIQYFRSRGFDLNFETDIITGHIDFLQIRNGYLHVLDYKPEARKEEI